MKTSFKKGDILIERCGCRYRVKAVVGDAYYFTYLGDRDVICWSIKAADRQLKLGNIGRKACEKP